MHTIEEFLVPSSRTPVSITFLETELNSVVTSWNCCVSLQMSAVMTEEYNVMVDSEGFIGTTICDAIDEVSRKSMSL